jgi:hypothetical protein
VTLEIDRSDGAENFRRGRDVVFQDPPFVFAEVIFES